MPNLPRCCPLVQILEALFILERVHTLPETRVFIRKQGLLLDQALKWLPHQFVPWMDITKNLVAQHEEAPIDPDVGATQRTDIAYNASGPSADNVKACCRL